MHAKKVAVPKAKRVGVMNINRLETQRDTEHRMRILRSRELKWSRKGGSFLLDLVDLDALVGDLASSLLCEVVGVVPSLFSFSTGESRLL